MLGGSEIAGRYVQSEVYEQTGDPRLASMARSGTSLLVYGGIINGREYSQYAMERMAPDTPSVRAE
ncbi:MAG: hypothetical protein K2O73_01190 [Lachnospiraceae bacterium]|nr:hypothetical protein [Lachnospiraceae bacterium]